MWIVQGYHLVLNTLKWAYHYRANLCQKPGFLYFRSIQTDCPRTNCSHKIKEVISQPQEILINDPSLVSGIDIINSRNYLGCNELIPIGKTWWVINHFTFSHILYRKYYSDSTFFVHIFLYIQIRFELKGKYSYWGILNSKSVV